MPRLEFFLVFTEDPPAADIVREDFIVRKDNNSGCVFRWIKNVKKDPVGVETSGTILSQGMKKDLLLLKVNSSGEFTQSLEEAIGTRKQELEKARLKSAHAQANNLQDIAQNILNNDGPGNLNVQPTIKLRRSRLPKKRSAEEKRQLKQKLDTMPCFTNGPNKVEVWENSGVYCPEGFLTTARLRYGSKPNSLFKVILRLLFPMRFRLLKGVSLTGSRGCVAVPQKLIESIVLYVQAVFRKNGGTIETMLFEPHKIVTNLISITRKKHKVFINDLPTNRTADITNQTVDIASGIATSGSDNVSSNEEPLHFQENTVHQGIENLSLTESAATPGRRTPHSFHYSTPRQTFNGINTGYSSITPEHGYSAAMPMDNAFQVESEGNLIVLQAADPIQTEIIHGFNSKMF